MITSTSSADNTALKKYQIIAPLLDPTLDQAKAVKLKLQIALNNDCSERTIRRWLQIYKAKGFEGLKPKSKTYTHVKPLQADYAKYRDEAIQLKREVPTRSISQIIMIMEMEGIAPPGVLKRSTLQRYLYDAGFGKKQLKKFAEASEASSKRFCKPHRMMLAQADIKYTMKLPIGPNGKMVQTYAVVIIDDHSKMILGSGIYGDQEAWIVEDAYRKAILKYGAFDTTYVDNGKQFISRQLINTLSMLGIRHLRAKPRACQSKGKVEVFNRFINSYVNECKAQNVRTLEEANYYWNLWVEQYYLNKPHEGIKEYYSSRGLKVPANGITPLQEFNRDTRQLRFIDVNTVAAAFLHHENRIVDKGACISFYGKKYEVSTSLIGAKVEISYDPAAKEIITVSYPGIEPFTAKPLKIGEYCDPKPAIPQCMLPVKPKESRFLKGLEKKRQESNNRRANAISFQIFKKEV